MGADAVDERVTAAQRAIRDGAWHTALDSLSGEEAGSSPACLELRAEAAYGAGDFEGCVQSWEDLHSLHAGRGDLVEAGRAAAMIAMYLMMDTGLMAPVRGWLRCADRHLDGIGEHPVQAIISMVRAYERFMCGAMDEARVEATRAIDLGERLGVIPAVVIGRTCTARLLIFDGEMETGLELLDEVGALLMSGAVDPLTTGMMYCEIICAAQGLLMPDLAAQWTDVMERWRHGSAVGGIHGRCRVHRAELLRLSGTCEAAEAEALAACAELAAVGAPFEAAMARLVVADGYESSGHAEQAAFERRVARDTLTSFGSEVWAERVDALIGQRPTEPVDASPPAPHAVFSCEGGTRTIGWDGATVVVRDLKGLRYIARLVAEPGREFHAAQLVRLESGADPDAAVAAGIPVLDEVAKEAYRRRLIDIDDDIADAVASNDIGRAELAERDRAYLVAELQRAAGLGGRDRTTLDQGERARVSATRSIRYSLDRLAEFSPAVAAHLRQHVHTGTFCSYEPDALHPVDWIL